MKICIYGAGAVGGLMAAWLSRAGHEVSVVARGKHLTAIRQNGLAVVSQGKKETYKVKADSDPRTLGPQDYVIVAVKAQSLGGVAAAITPLLGADTSIVTAMNGVPWWFFDRLPFASERSARGEGKLRLETLDPGGKLSRAMPTERLVGCVIHLAASTPEPGVIGHGMGTRLILGEPGGRNTARTERIVAALKEAGFEAAASGFIEKEFWVKLIGNVSFNPVAALTLATADRMIADDYVKAYLVAVMRECLAIGRAVGVDAAIDPEARMDMARKLGKFKPSTLQDLESGKSLEIDGLLTGTLEVARKAGVAAPFTEGRAGRPDLRFSLNRGDGPIRRPGRADLPRLRTGRRAPARRQAGHGPLRPRHEPRHRALHAQARQPVRELDPHRQRRDHLRARRRGGDELRVPARERQARSLLLLAAAAGGALARAVQARAGRGRMPRCPAADRRAGPDRALRAAFRGCAPGRRQGRQRERDHRVPALERRLARLSRRRMRAARGRRGDQGVRRRPHPPKGARPQMTSLHRLCVAPMMDWTDRHCRFFLRQVSSEAFLYTEMI